MTIQCFMRIIAGLWIGATVLLLWGIFFTLDYAPTRHVQFQWSWPWVSIAPRE